MTILLSDLVAVKQSRHFSFGWHFMVEYLLFKLPNCFLVLNVKQKSCEYPLRFSQFGLTQL